MLDEQLGLSPPAPWLAQSLGVGVEPSGIGSLFVAELCLSCCCLPAEHQNLEKGGQTTR